MTVAKAIDHRMKQAGHHGAASILTIVSDDHNVLCLTEANLDTWWASLDQVEKADVYEQHLEAQVVAEDSMQPAIRSAFIEAAIMKRFGEQAQTLLDSYPREFLTLPMKPSVQPEDKGEHDDEPTL